MLGTAGVAAAHLANESNEWSVKLALGATPLRLVRSVLTKVTLLAAMSLVGTIGVAAMELHFAVPLLPDGLPRAADVHVDGQAFAFALATVLTAWAVAGSIGWGVGGWSSRTQDGHAGQLALQLVAFGRRLVAVETAAAVFLLIGALLMARTWRALVESDLGFAHENILEIQGPAASRKWA